MSKESTVFRNLDKLTVRNTDDGKRFTDTTRLYVIEDLLKNCPFSFVKKGDLFYVFSQIPFERLGDDTLIISSHVDFKRGTKDCFSDTTAGKKVIGTYDNSATNAAIIELMKHKRLPKNVLVAFTGDEEEGSGGAIEVADFIHKLGIKARCIVLDVTEEGYKRKVAFSVENAYCNNRMLEDVITWMAQQENYFFVPLEKSQRKNELVERMLSKKLVAHHLADLDEAKDYHDKKIDSVSFCLPTKLMDPEGKHAPDSDPEQAMHSSKGLKIRKKYFVEYIEALCSFIYLLA